VPVVPGVTGMVVEIEDGRVRVEAPDVPPWFPPHAAPPQATGSTD
jgi:hypothetical protein